MRPEHRHQTGGVDSAAAWLRLARAVLLSTIGGVGMWSVVVVLPSVEAEFGVARAGASLPFSLTMIGFAFGGVLMGRLADRFGVMVPLALGAVALCVGYVGAAFATSLWQFAVLHGLLIGFLGSSASFSPLIADVTHWFERRRGIAVALCASGNYLAGTIWPPVVQHFIESVGWRQAHMGIGVFCLVTMLPLAMTLRRTSRTCRAPRGLRAAPFRAFRRGRCSFFSRSRASRVASRCRCRRSISWRTAANSATASPGARKCSR
jgi:MFS family permease